MTSAPGRPANAQENRHRSGDRPLLRCRSGAGEARLARARKLRKIRAGVYTSNLDSPLESVVQRNWRAIVEHLAPDAVIGYRSAMHGGPDAGKLVLVQGTRVKRIALPGLEIVVVPGAGPIARGPATDAPYGRLFVASEPRRRLREPPRGEPRVERPGRHRLIVTPAFG